MMGSPLVRYRLGWPRDVNEDQIQAISRFLGTAGGLPVIIEARGTTDMVEHYLTISRGRAGHVAAGLRAILPGLSLEAVEPEPTSPSRAVDLRLSTRRRPLRTEEPAAVSLAVLSALGHVGEDEQLILQWVLSRAQVPVSVPNRSTTLGGESLATELAMAPLGPKPLDPEVRNALRSKQAEVGWRGVGRIGVTAPTRTRQRQLIRQVLGALRNAEAPGVGFRVRSGSRAHLASARPSLLAPLRINALELATVAGWPMGSTAELPVARHASRVMSPSKAIPSSGRVIGTATFPGRERPVALGIKDARRHCLVVSPTGSGKSTLLCQLIRADIAAGRGLLVIEPRGDLIADVLRFIPSERAGDVVVFDPTDTDRPVGLNPLAAAGRSPELVADQLHGIMHNRYKDSWGPRTSDILGSALLTLARTPGMTLAALPLLLTNAGFRRRIVAGIDDPIALGPFWAGFENWSEQERAAAIAPALNKIRPYLLRPELRAVLGQAEPRFDFSQPFTQRTIALVNLPKGRLGPETTSLLGSLILARVWQVIQGRSAIPPDKRYPVPLYVDEFQDYAAGLPMDFADATSQARGLGAPLILSHQYLRQLEPALRSAVLNNAQSKIVFRLPHEDALVMAAGSRLSPEDFESLGAFEVYAQLVAGDTVQPWCSLKTEPLPEPISDPKQLRAASRQAYGVDRRDVEASLRTLVTGSNQVPGSDVGRRKRPGGTP